MAEARADGGAEALWSGGRVSELAARSLHASGGRLIADLGYGMAVGNRFIGTPRIGFGASETLRDYRLGYRLGVLGGAVPSSTWTSRPRAGSALTSTAPITGLLAGPMDTAPEALTTRAKRSATSSGIRSSGRR